MGAVVERKLDPWVVGLDTLKIALKSSEMVIKVATKTASGGARVFGKGVPGLSLVFGIVLAIQRCRKGEYWFAAGEVVSGVVACIPLYGTAASLSIDAVMLSVEIGLKMRKPGEAPQQTPEEKLEIAHRTLGVVGQAPDRAVFHRQYQTLARAVHPDLLVGEGEAAGELAHEMTQMVNEAWETVRTHYQWV